MAVIAQRTRPRRRPGAQPRRLRRPEPVHGARSRGGDPRDVPARRSARRSFRGRRICVHRARPRRLARGEALRPRRRAADRSPTSTRASSALAASSARSWIDTGRGVEPRSTCSPRARWAALLDDETVPRLRCRAIAGAANNQLADDGDRRPASPDRGFSGRPTSSSTPAGSINIAEEVDGYDPAAAPPARPGHRRHAARDLRRAPTRPARPPLTAAMELARRRLDGAAPQRRLRGNPRFGPGTADPPEAGPRPEACPGGRRASPSAAGRSGSGTSSHAASSNSSTVRAPAAMPSTRGRSRSRRCATYSSSLAAGSSTGGPCPAAGPTVRAGAASRALRGSAPAPRVGGDEDAALAQDGIAGQRGGADDKRQVVGRMPAAWPPPPAVRRRSPSAQQPVDVAARGRRRACVEARSDRWDRLRSGRRGRGSAPSRRGRRGARARRSRPQGDRAGPGRGRPATPGREPTIQELVPESVNGPGLSAAQPQTISCAGTSSRVTA